MCRRYTSGTGPPPRTMHDASKPDHHNRAHRPDERRTVMTTQTDDVQAAVIAAVQRELNQFSDQVSSEVQRLRTEMAADRAARAELEEQLLALAPSVERASAGNTAFQAEIQRALEERLSEFATLNKRRHEEMDARIGRVVDEANIGLAAAVESAARPIVKQVEHRQEL